MKKPKPTEKEKAWSQFAEAFAVYLSTVGWQAIVVSSPRIQHEPGEDKSFNYEFCVRFTGQKVSES